MTPALSRSLGALGAALLLALGTATPALASVSGVVDVAAGATLSVRSTPSTTGIKIGSLADGASISIICASTGSSVTGTYGTTTQWDKISTGYVSHAYVKASAAVPSCSAPSTNGTVDVAAGATLSVRSTPSTTGTKVGSLADGAKITIVCTTSGSSVTGTFGTTTRWDKISTGYVSHAYVSSTATVPDCTTSTPTPPPPSTTASAKVTATVNAATSMVGVYPYVYAGGSFYGATTGVDDGYPSDVYTKGFDCSGLMEYAFYQGAGIKVDTTSRLQYSQGAANGWLVPLAQRKAGDMVFFSTNTSDQSKIYHVALLMSTSSIVQAASHSAGLNTNLGWAPGTTTMPYVVRPIR